ncbi:MAG: cell division protein FtsA [Candidatus Sungbacteria bacterium RIFCSPLOWO2_01_FULL_60_25]|uniref:Cell division protein FtsA n=1 Tax=Candidatus Sungbacteria bacterium RIFCSPLOWO2_01_FULL_60_25 TaxID=1802281 RepID=A0A1G2LD63_9BACT|nr:MAG: cell division protein FtsA [Candidatus Sungbacteria bacterium RIFCSPLOWO2_01_FULL_60_25]
MRTISVGIDIGTTTVTTLITEERRGREVRIVGVGRAPSAGMRRGAIADVDAAAQAIRASVLEAGRAAGITVRSANLGVGGAHLGTFLTRGVVAVSRADGEITDGDTDRALQAAEGFISKNPNREIIHIIPREFKIDGQGGLANPVGLVGMKLEAEALVIDGAKQALGNIVRACELAGIAVDDWAANIIAASNVLLSREQKELGVMLLDLGAGTSDYAVFEEGRLLDAGAIPIGGMHITSDIAIGFRTTIAAAEAIKIRHAQAIAEGRLGKRDIIALADFTSGDTSVYATRDLIDIVTARLADIFELSNKALKRIGRSGLLPAGVVLAGGVAELPAIRELARREMKLPAEVVRTIASEGFEGDIPADLAVPLGLALWTEEGRGILGHRRRRSWSGIPEALKRIFRAFIP